jgi:hypothetical protein
MLDLFCPKKGIYEFTRELMEVLYQILLGRN